jgi:HSP20 family molecular chaperone IbpA
MIGRKEVVQVKNFERPENTTAAIFDELRNDLADWMTTDKDMVWRPVTELTQEGDEFAVRALVPGVDPDDIQVLVAPETLLIKGELHGVPEHRKLLKSVQFKRPVNPRTAQAEIKDGMLSIHVDLADAARAKRLMAIAA